MVDDYYDQTAQYLEMRATPEELSTSQNKKLVVKVDFQHIIGKLYKLGPDDILRRCVLPHEQGHIFIDANAGVVG